MNETGHDSSPRTPRRPTAPATSQWATRMGTRLLSRHPAVRTDDQLTVGERAADRMRNGMGSWPFVFAALAFLGVWMLYNRGSGFDPFPFILLNLVLSCLAAMQGAILLIAAKRSDQISAELAMHDYETNTEALAHIRSMKDVAVEVVALRELVETLVSNQSDSQQ